jgi:hypothetical protein
MFIWVHRYEKGHIGFASKASAKRFIRKREFCPRVYAWFEEAIGKAYERAQEVTRETDLEELHTALVRIDRIGNYYELERLDAFIDYHARKGIVRAAESGININTIIEFAKKHNLDHLIKIRE